ncbi:MAG TPA: ABC transporter substrate-binding protein [Stellaceae bacterium]|jgi:NitT/TauT family transport system substrate-binding protein|nr:ABC transporter substrate-binding protein [Stellaceae bacterium]
MPFRHATLAAISITMLTAASHIASADPVKIRAGWGNTPTAMAPIIFAKPELLKHYGQSYTMEPVHFAGSAPEITALASGDLDIATLAPSSMALAIENAHLSDLRVIGDENQDGVEGWFTSPFFVLKDGPLKTVEDLKGKVLASNAIGGGLDIGIRAMLRQHHLDDKHDATIIESPFPTLVPMLEEHKADLISAVPPFSFIAEAKGDVRTLFTLRDAIGTSEFIFDVARKSFIDKNHAALVDFTEDWIRSLRWFLDPKNHDEAVKIVADYTKLPPSSFASWVFQHQDVYRDPDHRANLKALQETLDVQQQLGIQKTHIEAAQYADQSLVDEAAKRVGPGN